MVAAAGANKVAVLLGNSDDSFQLPVYYNVGVRLEPERVRRAARLRGLVEELCAREIVSQEETLSQPMLDGQVLLVGKIDQRVKRKADGTRFIRDFKTSANFADLMKTTQMNEQFLLYMVLEALQKGETERVEGAIVTAGGIDSHIHFICPQQIEEALMSGVTTMLGGGTGPAAAPDPPRTRIPG